MVNLRYHIVSLAAVFLALGLGILAGTTVIDQQVLKGLRANTAALRHDLDRVRAQVSEQRGELDVWQKFGAAIEPSLLEGHLAGRAVVLLADKKVPSAIISDLAEALSFANTKRPTRLTLTDKWSFADPAAVGQLAGAFHIASSDQDEILDQAGMRLGTRLAGSSNPRTDGDQIRALIDAGFLDAADIPSSGPFPAANALVIVVSSGDVDEAPSPDRFFVPFLEAVTRSRIAGVAEPTTTAGGRSLAELVRGDRTIARSVCTVDHIDTVPGLISIVYALKDVGAGKPAAHYGTRGGDTPIVPDLSPA